MKKLRLSVILFILCMLHSFGETPRFSIYQSQSYVPYSNINDMVEDSYGLMWIATGNGLFKFNGYDYIQYLQDKDRPNSLPNNNCRELLEDSHKRLWIGTDNGIVIYDRQTDEFIRIQLKNLKSRNIVSIDEDEDGFIWALSFQELIKLSSEGVQLQTYSYPNAICMHLDADKIWLGSMENGLHLFDKSSQTITPLSIPKLDEEKKEMHVRFIFPSSDGNLYIGTRDLGLIIHNRLTQETEIYSTSTLPNVFISDFILSIYEDSRKNIWIGSVNGQLIKYNPSLKEFTVPYFKYPSGVNQLTISCIMEDKQHDIWAGTHHYWIYQCNQSTNAFELFQRNDEVGSLTHNAVTCFSDNSEKVLVGTDGGGLNIYDKKSKTFYSDNRLGKIILDIKQASNPNEFWINTWGNSQVGLALYNVQTKEYKKYEYKAKDSNTITSNLLRSILVDPPYVWVSTDGAGLCRINTQTDKIDNKYNCQEPIFSRKNPQWINHIMKDHKGRYWFCSSECIILYENNKCKRLSINKESTENLQNEVKMAIEDHDGNILFATANNGLIQYNEADSTFINLSQQYKLPFNLSSLCEDNNHRLWIISAEEIIRLDRETGNSHHFNLKNDLSGNPFTPNAIYRSGDELYVGSNNGFFRFNVNKLDFSECTPQIYLKDLYIWGEKQKVSESSVLQEALAFTDTLTLNYNSNSISIDFYAIDYKHADELTYQYRMDGVQDGWVNTEKMRQVYFTNLAPGTYVFQVKALSINTRSEVLSQPITIVILPPWWKTWWFRIACGIAFLLFLHLIYYLRMREHKIKQAKLEKLVSERTEELRLKNQEVQIQKENLEIQNKRLDESLDTKNKILSVIAHDLRNPLTAIVGNLSLMSEEEDNSKIKQVCKSAKNLQTQMENLLDWARIQNQSILYTPKDVFLDALSKECITLLQGLIEEKNIQLTFTNQSEKSAYVDQRMISTVCRNLLNNAIKFTRENGHIHISIQEEGDQIKWSIQDDGVGMTEEQRMKLFDKNTTTTTFGTKNEKGSGLGLKICQEFIAYNKGQFIIESEKGVGTTISILLPQGTQIQSSKETSYTLIESDMSATNEESKRTLLIVDDSEEILSYEYDLLRPHYHVITSTNGEDALQIARKEIPDLIISDIVMPKMDGREFCHCIKEDVLTQHIPVILLTSENTVEDQVQGLNIGADDYITKPFNAELLKAKIATILKNKELQKEHLRTRILRMPDIEIPESIDDTLIAKINDVIKQNIAESNLTVEFLASKTALSRVQLFRKMKAITGCSPSEYIKAIRLEHAAEILVQSKQSIADVAYMVGFSDPKYFSNCFSEKFGVTPSQYVKNHKA